MISAIVYFREIILVKLWNFSETTPSISKILLALWELSQNKYN